MNKNRDSVVKILEEYGEFIPVPTELLVSPRYNLKGKAGRRGRLRHNSIILYGLLLLLQDKQNNVDEQGNTYVTITGDDIATVVGTTTSSTPKNMVNQLEEFKLIERKTVKTGIPYELYIKEIVK